MKNKLFNGKNGIQCMGKTYNKILNIQKITTDDHIKIKKNMLSKVEIILSTFEKINK